MLMKLLSIITLISISLLAIEVEEVKKERLFSEKEYIGNIYSKEERVISTRLMGYIKSIKVEEGDIVKRGDLLFEVDPSDIESALTQAKANLMKANSTLLMAKLNLADAKRDFERYKNLYEKEVVPKREFEKIKLNMEMKSSQVDLAKSIKVQAESALKQAKAQVKYASVKSPIDGVVISKAKKTSEIVSPGQPVLIVSSLDGIRVKTLVQESEIKNLQIGQDARVEVPALAKEIDAYVISIVPSADATTHSYIVKLNLKERDGLTPGMYAKVLIKTDMRDALTIPFSAVTKRGGITGVFVKSKDIAKFKPIEILSKFNQKVEIDGLKAKESVILYPRSDLQDSTEIR